MPTDRTPCGGRVLCGLWGRCSRFCLVPFFDEARSPRVLVSAGASSLACWSAGSSSARAAGRARARLLGTAITGAIALVFWVLFLLSGYDMIQVSMRGRFSGPMEAVINVFTFMVDYGKMFYSPMNLFVCLGGGIIAGLLTDAVGSRYR